MLKRDHFPGRQERFNLDETMRLPRQVCKRQSRDDKGDGFMTSRHEQALRGRDCIPIFFFLHIFHVISVVLLPGLQAKCKCTIPDDDRRGSLMVERTPGSTVKMQRLDRVIFLHLASPRRKGFRDRDELLSPHYYHEVSGAQNAG
jgi:hypothetical protein